MPRGVYDRMRGRPVDLYICLEDFVDLKSHELVRKGDLVRAGHPLITNNPRNFARAQDRVRFDIEQATAEPGARR